MSKTDLERRIEQLVKEELRGSALYLASGRKKYKGGDFEYKGDENMHNDAFSYSGGLMAADGRKKRKTAGSVVHDHHHHLGGLMMADGRKKKAKSRGDGGEALKVFREKLDMVREKYPNKTFRECQQIAKNM